MESNTLRIGVVGGGGISGVHLQNLQNIEGVAVTGLADISPEAAKATAGKFNVLRHTTDWHELLPEVDALLVCVPTHLHADIATEAMNAGKHIFCEKPIARTLEQADAIIEAAQRNNVALQVGFVRRFDDEWLAFEDALRAAKIGRPVVWHDISTGYGPDGAWYNREEMGGGPILDGAIHTIDFALKTFGEAEWAFGHMRTMRESNTALDTGTATIRFRSGDELLLVWSWGLPQGCSGSRVFEILGPQGTLTWPKESSGDPHEEQFIINRGTGETQAGETKERISFPKNALSLGYQKQMEEFIAVARGQVQPRVGGTEGREALRVALAILESARNNEIVRL